MIAIVIVVALIALIIGGVCFAKSKNKFCFKAQEGDPDLKDPEVVTKQAAEDTDLESGTMLNEVKCIEGEVADKEKSSSSSSSSEEDQPEADKAMREEQHLK